MTTTTTRNAPLAVTYALVVLGIAFAVVGAIYFSHTAGALPAFFPGHLAGSAHKHMKHGAAAVTLAVVCWVAAWLSSGRRSV